MERLSIKTRKMEEKELRLNGGRDPDYIIKNPSESYGGVLETYIRVSFQNVNYKPNSNPKPFPKCIF